MSVVCFDWILSDLFSNDVFHGREAGSDAKLDIHSPMAVELHVSLTQKGWELIFYLNGFQAPWLRLCDLQRVQRGWGDA